MKDAFSIPPPSASTPIIDGTNKRLKLCDIHVLNTIVYTYKNI